MTKRSNDKNFCKNFNYKKICDNKELSVIDENLLLNAHVGILNSESPLSLFDNDSDCRIPKKQIKMTNGTEEMRTCASLRLSHFVIVNSVLKETNINPEIEALLPLPLNNIYQKFINSKKYIENFHTKDEFYRDVGLLGIGIEERIYNKRKALEDSLKRCIRLRPNPKPRRQFDGTLVNRPLKNVKVKYNVFTIGTDPLKRSHRRQSRKIIKKKSIVRRPSSQRLDTLKKVPSESQGSSDESEVHRRSIALSRTKRKPKGPQLDFKYCYNDGSGVVRARKYVDPGKDDQFMEIDDSDSSSVIEVCAPLVDKENSVSHDKNNVASSKSVISPRKGWPPRENKALNLLDKLRLGLQCTVMQTEDEVIIQHLTMEDLSTLKRRLHGLAPFKNIEAEYDKNGFETARATIDRRVLNLPLKGGHNLSHGESRPSGDWPRKTQSATMEKVKIRPSTGRYCNAMDDYCASWVRPKVRSVKKIRKLYTQGASTPNILARSQPQSRGPDATSRSSDKCQSSSSSIDVTASNCGQHSAAAVSFYPQITSSVIIEPSIGDSFRSIKSEPRPSTIDLSSTWTTEASPSVSVPITTTTMTTTTATIAVPGSVPSSDSQRRGTVCHTVSQSTSGTPATAMSASQLLMLRKGAVPSTATIDPPCHGTSTMAISRNDQLIANHILKPFKKPNTSSSPSKLEIDDEETDFELSPSLIAQANNNNNKVDIVTSGPLVRVQHIPCPFISKPLIQTTTGGPPRRSIHLPSTAILRPTHNVPILPRVTKLPMPATVIDTASLATVNTLPNNSSASSNIAPGSPNLKVKHRKWTHNFLTSNSINFREVLCAAVTATATSQKSIVPLPSAILTKPLVTLQQSTTTPPHCTPMTTLIDQRPPITVANKGSSVVLKSLLVGANSGPTTDSLGGVNKTVIWAPKYLTPSCPGQDSKIKWQVGGSVVASQSPVFLVAKENKSLEMVTTTDVIK